jgi:Ca2+-binding EF-hand superfamily protein
MKRCSYLIIVILLLTAALPIVAAETTSQPARPIPDHCRGPIDPYDQAREKQRFFSAAGKDGELTLAEADANRKKPAPQKPFVRPFDRTAEMKLYDRDGNGRLDWIEVEVYRREFRRKVLKKFDVNKDGHLRGPERQKANAWLHARSTGKDKSPDPKVNVPLDRLMGGNDDRPMMAEYDTNSDGQLSDEEVRAAFATMREKRRRQMLQRYDTDGDGQLSKEERQAMWQGRGGVWRERAEAMALRHFDADGDGELSDDEKKEIGTFMKELGQTVASYRDTVMDIDGDGEITEQERSIRQKQFMIVGLKMMVKGRALMDTDTDGEVTMAERQAFQQRAGEQTWLWFQGFSNTFDYDSDGRLDKGERNAMILGVDKEIQRRIDENDANKDGRLDPFEAETLIWKFGQDVGLVPRPVEQ